MDHIIYALIFNEGNLVAAASAEINYEHSNAEMTDFATLDSEQGNGLAKILLYKLEKTLIDMNINTLFTIARSKSIGMNHVFSKMDYSYTDTLINNCHIDGNFEDMNVWCKF